MYAVSFDLDTNCLNEHYTKETYHNAYAEIKAFMIKNGFEWKQGCLYFGDSSKINAVSCVTTVQKLAKTFPLGCGYLKASSTFSSSCTSGLKASSCSFGNQIPLELC